MFSCIESGDYQTNPTLTIPSSTAVGNSVCHQITIIDDDIVEGDESFIIAISVANANDVINGGDVVTVTILDDDGRWPEYAVIRARTLHAWRSLHGRPCGHRHSVFYISHVYVNSTSNSVNRELRE